MISNSDIILNHSFCIFLITAYQKLLRMFVVYYILTSRQLESITGSHPPIVSKGIASTFCYWQMVNNSKVFPS